MACCEKYKPYILKYKALISKYMPYIFDEKWYLIFNDLQEWKNMRFRAWILPLSGSFGKKVMKNFFFVPARLAFSFFINNLAKNIFCIPKTFLCIFETNNLT